MCMCVSFITVLSREISSHKSFNVQTFEILKETSSLGCVLFYATSNLGVYLSSSKLTQGFTSTGEVLLHLDSHNRRLCQSSQFNQCKIPMHQKMIAWIPAVIALTGLNSCNAVFLQLRLQSWSPNSSLCSLY